MTACPPTRAPAYPRTRLPALFVMCCLAAGCGDPPPRTPAQGTYGPISARPSANIAPASPPPAAPVEGAILLKCLQTELSPATLFQTASDGISFFTELKRHGLGGPTRAAFSGITGPRAFQVGEKIEPAHMEENWVMVWFAGARGWTNGDSPWVVYLQHKPKAMRLDENGLHFEFRRAAGDIVLLPLYGSYITPAEGRVSRTQFTGKTVKTWQWAKVLPREPLMHARYWASALREFPAYCQETFSVDRSTDSVTMRQEMQWHAIDDDWRTKHLKLNPVSPPLALATHFLSHPGEGRGEGAFPAKFNRVVMDLVMPTPAGPYSAAEGEGPLDVTFSILQHVNEQAEAAHGVAASAGQAATQTLSPPPKPPLHPGTWTQWTIGPPSHSIAAARQAYRQGDIDAYNYGCYLFARALTQQWFARAAPDYFAKYELPHDSEKLNQSNQSQLRKESLFPLFAPVKSARLIPSGAPSPFVIGIEREVSGPTSQLVQEVRTEPGEWPLVILRRSEKDHWPIGRVQAGTNKAPRKAVRGWHSRNTEKIVLLK